MCLNGMARVMLQNLYGMPLAGLYCMYNFLQLMSVLTHLKIHSLFAFLMHTKILHFIFVSCCLLLIAVLYFLNILGVRKAFPASLGLLPHMPHQNIL